MLDRVSCYLYGMVDGFKIKKNHIKVNLEEDRKLNTNTK